MNKRGDPWQTLKKHTDARIALGRVGNGLPTRELLAFQIAHAQARDAIHTPFEPCKILDALKQTEYSNWTTIEVKSAARDRAEYLQYPNKGRCLAEGECEKLPFGSYDIAFVVGDGLSSTAVHQNAIPLLVAVRKILPKERIIAPLILAHNARVFLTDPIAEALGAKQTVMLIGERPGLSSPNSLGAYLTHAPRLGMQNHDRNVISNIRPEGLNPERASCYLAWLMEEAFRLGFSGVELKGDPPAHIFAPQMNVIRRL